MPFTRLIEARSIVTHGLAENAARHEEYMAEFRAMTGQVERLYPLWLKDRKTVAPTEHFEDYKCPFYGAAIHFGQLVRIGIAESRCGLITSSVEQCCMESEQHVEPVWDNCPLNPS